MTKRRHDWSYVQQRVTPRMHELGYYTNTEFIEHTDAIGRKLSIATVRDFTTNPNPRFTNNRRGDTIPKLCDALRWRHDAIDRLLAGLEPIEAAPNHGGEVVPLRAGTLDERMDQLEQQANEGFDLVAFHAEQLDELSRRLVQLEEQVRRLSPPQQTQESSSSS
jgi:uncharacterized protein (DUF2237 family)